MDVWVCRSAEGASDLTRSCAVDDEPSSTGPTGYGIRRTRPRASMHGCNRGRSIEHGRAGLDIESNGVASLGCTLCVVPIYLE